MFNHCPRRISFFLRPGSKRQWQETEQEIEEQKEQLFSSHHAKMLHLCSNWSDGEWGTTFPLQGGDQVLGESLLDEEFLSQEEPEVFADLQQLIFSGLSQVMAFVTRPKGKELCNLWETSACVSSLKQKN